VRQGHAAPRRGLRPDIEHSARPQRKKPSEGRTPFAGCAPPARDNRSRQEQRTPSPSATKGSRPEKEGYRATCCPWHRPSRSNLTGVIAARAGDHEGRTDGHGTALRHVLSPPGHSPTHHDLTTTKNATHTTSLHAHVRSTRSLTTRTATRHSSDGHAQAASKSPRHRDGTKRG
jgi:hypothetical protein